MLDQLIREARTGGKGQDATIRSVVGTIRIVESDPNLSTADSAVRALFSVTLGRQSASMHSKARHQKLKKLARENRQTPITGGQKEIEIEQDGLSSKNST